MFSREFAGGALILEEEYSLMNLKIFEPHLHLKENIYTSAPYRWWSWSRGADPGDKFQSVYLWPEDQLHLYEQLKDSMDISSGFPRPLWPGVWHLSQAFLEMTLLLALASKPKERTPLISWPRRWNFKTLSQVLFLLLCLDSRCRKKDQYYYLGTMKRLNWSKVHPGMNNDLKNQCCEDFDRLVTFHFILWFQSGEFAPWKSFCPYSVLR